MSLPGWNTQPISGVSLSAGGLLALADLSTIAQRTAIAGGSSWLDSLLLAPGLHYQQAAEALVERQAPSFPSGTASVINAVETLKDGQAMTFAINNAATRRYIQKIARPGEVVTLNVGMLPQTSRYRLKRSSSGMHATIWADDKMPDLGWLSHLLYLISPVLTVVALVFLGLLRDWWSFGSLLALMLGRVLNIFVIKQRSRPQRHTPDPAPPPAPPSPGKRKRSAATTPEQGIQGRLTEYVVFLGDGRSSVRLRGTTDDLQAITADAWLRSKTPVEGYMEAVAKLLVYLVAALSGNMTQVGSLTFMCLLLVSAGLLALSNAHAKSFRMNGRVAAPLSAEEVSKPLRGTGGERTTTGAPSPAGGAIGNAGEHTREETPASTGVSDDLAEKGQARMRTQG
ncbi:hypothetical protein VTK73DRAFT_2760 [Phialemonium thermophilum]|uniref:Uncharacterized protein n=1 Tax=Phialemonium thermophilum TaxID=223376 RepID=A0ABR3Y186_9PEZI